MARAIDKPTFLADLTTHIQQHMNITRTRYQTLSAAQLNWSPRARDWSIVQCFDHLNQTHDYYRTKFDTVFAAGKAPAASQPDRYTPSFWGGIYMFFAFNPRLSFPAPAVTKPQATPSRDVLAIYLTRQQELLHVLEEVESIDLSATRIQVEKGILFNLGDCLKILVYHDALHMGQAADLYSKL
jgi:hypothetical protein